MTIPNDLLDALMKDYMNPEDLIGETGLLKQLTKQLLERAMQAEMTEHLGYEKNASSNKKTSNSRNGSYKKRIKGEFGNLDIAVPRDRESSFDPIIIPKGQSRFTGFDDKIIALYTRGMTTRDIQAHLEEIYGVEASPTLVSQVTHKPCKKRSLSGKIGPWMKSIPSSIWMPSGLKFGRMAGLSIKLSIWLSASPLTESRKFLGCGPQRPKEPNSGCRLLPN